MELAIQPCVQCADLHGEPSTAAAHPDLRLTAPAESGADYSQEHYRCWRCHAEFARLLEGKTGQLVWMLVNAGQH